MRHEKLEVNGKIHDLFIHFEDRENATVALCKTGIILHIPSGLQREQQFKEIQEMKRWAKEKLLEKPRIYEKKESRLYKDGDLLKVGDQEYSLKIEAREKQSSSARRIGNIISLFISSKLSDEKKQKHISILLSRLIARERLKELHVRVHALNDQHFQKPLKKIFFKNQKSQWGSCSVQGNINISTRLLFAPRDVLEYVCIHELAHLTEFNHSENFWTLVEKAMPTYKEKEDWLKKNKEDIGF